MESDKRTRRIILRMFRAKMDTTKIAQHFKVTEAEIANELHKAREEEHADNREFTLSAVTKPSVESGER